MLITGGRGAGKSVDIYHTNRGSSFILPDIPDEGFGHTQDGSLMCGGSEEGRRSCRRWNPNTGAWDLVTESLTVDRVFHISWTPADGSVTYLMGGLGSAGKTSEIIDKDYGVRSSFLLKHRTE